MHGIVLLNELFEPMNLTQVQLAQYLKISVQRINEIVRGKRGIATDAKNFDIINMDNSLIRKLEKDYP